MSTNPSWSLNYEFSGSCITPRLMKKVQCIKHQGVDGLYNRKRTESNGLAHALVAAC